MNTAVNPEAMSKPSLLMTLSDIKSAPYRQEFELVRPLVVSEAFEETLQAELGRSQALEQERSRLAVLERKYEAILSKGGVKPADPQMEGLSKLIGWEVPTLEVSVLLLIAVIIEFTSAFGFYFTFGHIQKARIPPSSPATAPVVAEPASAPAIKVAPPKKLVPQLKPQPEPPKLVATTEQPVAADQVLG